ncbi:universal stress protein [Actinomycetota bacterium Odt1-20B]
MEQPLIVGVDGSEPSLQALDWAADEAVRREATLRVVYGAGWGWYERHELSAVTSRSDERVFADHIVAQAVERANRRGPAVKAIGEVVPEDPAAALIRETRTACAVVVGSRGRGRLAGMLLGSVGLSVAAHAESPVIVVRGGTKNRSGGFGQVTVGVGEVQETSSAVAFARAAAEQRGAALRAVRAWRCLAHEVPDYPRASGWTDGHQRRAEAELDEALREPTVSTPGTPGVRREVVEGHARVVLLNAAVASDLLVVGARRRKGHVGMQLGPVNHALLHHADCPVAIVPRE